MKRAIKTNTGDQRSIVQKTQMSKWIKPLQALLLFFIYVGQTSVAGRMWSVGGEVNWHSPEEEGGGACSDLFKTHTIWVARLQAQAETADSVSEGEEKKSDGESWEFACLHPPHTPPPHMRTFKHANVSFRNFHPSGSLNFTGHCIIWSSPSWVGDLNGNYI